MTDWRSLPTKPRLMLEPGTPLRRSDALTQHVRYSAYHFKLQHEKMCLWGFRPGPRQPGLFTTKDRRSLSRVLGSWVAGSFVFQELWRTGILLKGVGD